MVAVAAAEVGPEDWQDFESYPDAVGADVEDTAVELGRYPHA